MNHRFPNKFILLAVLTTITVSLPNDYCVKDTDCTSYPYDVCHTSKHFCTRKSLFPIFPMEIVGIIGLCALSILASSAGIGGGPFILAIMLGFFNFGTKGAIAMSNGVMFLNSFAITLIAMRDKNPTDKHKPLIDMNLSLIFITPMLAGAFSGSVAAVVMPSSFQLTFLALMFTVALVKSTIDANKRWAKETKEI